MKQIEKDIALREKILIELALHPAYGYRRIALLLGVGKKRIERNMRIFGMRSKIRKQSHVGRRYSAKGVPNLTLGILPTKANAIWAGDFTRLTFCRRILYLAVVMDTYTREVVGWEVAYHHRSALVINALHYAVVRRGKVPSVFHSDQGSEYTSAEYLAWLDEKGITPSHSWKGRPWHNGIVESFFNSFKREFGDVNHHGNIARLFEGIALWVDHYNRERTHSSLHMPPREFFIAKNSHQVNARR